MKKFYIYKYQGAGNDFVILDNRDGRYDKISNDDIKKLCCRRFGVGSDGLMLLGDSVKYDFSMKYYNSDGNEGSMCGNGGRCLVAFAAHRGIEKYEFDAIDGYHIAQVLEKSSHRCIVRLKMIDLNAYDRYSDNSFFLNTGSPHYVEFINDIKNYPVDEKGKYWRYHKDFTGGTNVNFVEIEGSKIKVRTYERGVEAETYACGTGVTASAISTFLQTKNNYSKYEDLGEGKSFYKYDVEALGDNLNVEFIYDSNNNRFSDIYLTGPATFVFEACIEI